MAVLYDDFSGASVDLTRWTVNGTPAIVGGQVELKTSSTSSGAPNDYLRSTNLFVWTDTEIVVSFSVTDASSVLLIAPWNYYPDYVEVSYKRSNDSLYFASWDDSGLQYDEHVLLYNAAAHKWLRYRHSGSTAAFDLSADGSSWTEVHVSPVTLTDMPDDKLFLLCFSGNGSGSVAARFGEVYATQPDLSLRVLVPAATVEFAGQLPAPPPLSATGQILVQPQVPVIAAPPLVVTVPAATVELVPQVATTRTLQITAATPVDGAQVPSAYPIFQLQVRAAAAVMEGLSCVAEVQLSDSEDFTTPTHTLNRGVDFADDTVPTALRVCCAGGDEDCFGDPEVTCSATGPLAEQAWYWRARVCLLAPDGHEVVCSEYLATRTLHVVLTAPADSVPASPAPGAGWVDGTVVVAADAALAGSLWYLDPPYGSPGDEVTIIGQGLAPGACTGELVVSWQGTSVTPTGYECIAAGPDAYTADRRCDADDRTTNIEHERVVVIVPAEEPTSDAVFIEGG